MDTTLDLVALLERVPNATITVQLSDLNAFARRLIADTREEYEQEISDRLLAIKENYLTADTVKDVLHDVSHECPSRIMRGCHLALTMAPTMALDMSLKIMQAEAVFL